MKKLFKTGLAVVMTTGLLIPTHAFAVDTKGYVDKFNNMDFQSMMKNTSQESLEGYFDSYNTDLGNVDSTYQGKFNNVQNNLKGHSIIYQDEKGNMQFEFAKDEKELDTKYSSLKSKLSNDVSKKVKTEESNYTKKDSINKKLMEVEKKSSNGTHTSKFLSYKSSASSLATKNYNRVDGKYSSATSGISGKYNPDTFALSANQLQSRVTGSPGFVAASSKFDSFGNDLKNELQSKYAEGLAKSAEARKAAADAAKAGQVTEENAKSLHAPIKKGTSIYEDLKKVEAYAERVEMGAADPINDLDKLKKELKLKNNPEDLIQSVAGNYIAAKVNGEGNTKKTYLPEDLRRTSSFNVIMNLGEKQGADQYKEYKAVKKNIVGTKEQFQKSIQKGDCSVSFKQGDLPCRILAGDKQTLESLNRSAAEVGLGENYFNDLKKK